MIICEKKMKRERILQEKNRYIVSDKVAISKGEKYGRKIVYNFFNVLKKNHVEVHLFEMFGRRSCI